MANSNRAQRNSKALATQEQGSRSRMPSIQKRINLSRGTMANGHVKMVRMLDDQIARHTMLSKSHQDPASREISRSMVMYGQAHKSLLATMQELAREARMSPPGPTREAFIEMQRNTQRNLQNVVRDIRKLALIQGKHAAQHAAQRPTR